MNLILFKVIYQNITEICNIFENCLILHIYLSKNKYTHLTLLYTFTNIFQYIYTFTGLVYLYKRSIDYI